MHRRPLAAEGAQISVALKDALRLALADHETIFSNRGLPGWGIHRFKSLGRVEPGTHDTKLSRDDKRLRDGHVKTVATTRSSAEPRHDDRLSPSAHLVAVPPRS